MGVFSFLKRKDRPQDVAPPAPDATLDSVQAARTRARQRLIGALVLLSIGIVGFPLLFESQPRPIPVDIPIEIPSKDGVAPLVMPGPRSPGATASTKRAETVRDVITESSADAGRDVTAALPSTPSASAVAARTAAPAASASTDRTAAAGREAASDVRREATASARLAPASSADASRARALLEGRAPVPLAAASGATGDARFIVQVGAFADPAAVRDVRLKVERLGLKTYTQVAQTPAGDRIRVRVGPFSSRAEADRAMARVRSAGVVAAVLTL